MKKLEEKFIFLLADTSFKETEVNKFIKKLKNGGLDHCFNKALKVRELIEASYEFIDEDWHEPISEYKQKVIDQVEQLLRGEVGMTVKQSIDSLSKELSIKIPSTNRSFRDQLLYLCNNFEGPQIINAAHKVRNSFMHNYRESDWPLKDK
jgi:hypothetical protein